MPEQFIMTRANALAVGAGAIGAALGAQASVATARAAGATAFHFDEARFRAILAKPARHRQCCASTKPSWSLLDAMMATMYAYQFDLNEGPGTAHEVGVVYHPAAVTMALDDEIWNALILRALPRMSSYYTNELSHLSSKGNPFLHRRADVPVTNDTAIAALVSRGASFFVCNNALLGLADDLGTALHENSDRVHARLLAGLVPGAMAVPAGVMAIDACQQAGFTYLQTAL